MHAGRLIRLPLHIGALEGRDLALEATFFVSADWRGPVVLGWTGCLERFRFGVDPFKNRFYFGGAEDIL